MSTLKIIPTALPNKGIVLNKPEEFLKNNFSTADSRNMEFHDELLQGRLGLTKFDSTELSGPVLLVDQFWTFAGTWYLLFATTKDIYSYNFAVGTGTASYFDILTPVYTTGSISVDGTGASPTVVLGSGIETDFDGNGIKAGDFLKVGTGTPTTNDTWYEVATVTAGTGTSAELTLTAAGPSVFDSQFTIRKCFSGTSTDFWQSRTFIDSNLGDTWIATNGVDMPIRWTGTGQIVILGTGSSGITAAKFVEVYKDRVIFLWTVESANQPQRIRWSAVADCETWDSGDFKDFMDDGYWITGTSLMADYHVIFRERDAYLGRYVGGDYTFDHDKSSSCAGLWASNSLVVLERDAYYYGPDNKFHHWNLLTDEAISEEILPRTKDYDPNLEQYIYGWNVESRNQIRWMAPYSDTSYNNEMVVYDYSQGTLYLWEYEQEQALCCIGEYLNTEDLYVDYDPWDDYYVDEQDGFWDTRLFLDNAPVLVYGGYDGYIRNADTGYDDDGTAYTRVFESIRENYKLPYNKKRLWKQQFWFNSEVDGNVTIKLKKDDSNTFVSTTKTISLIDTTRDIIKKNISWDKEAQNFKTRVEATNHFAMLGYLNFIFKKGTTYR